MDPTNDIERLLENPGFGKHDYPELYRLLRESQLFFLAPRQSGPEAVPWTQPDTIVPDFIPLGNHKTGHHIPIFTSKAACRSACRQLGARNGFSYFHMTGRNLFELLGRQLMPIAINPVCGTNPIGFSVEDVKGLASGSAMEMRETSDVQGTLQLVHPNDYVKELVHALLIFFRKTPAIRAAWLMKDVGVAGKENCQVYILDVAGPEETIRQDFSLIIEMLCPKNITWGVQFIDSTDSASPQISDDFPPIYGAPGHRLRGLFVNP